MSGFILQKILISYLFQHVYVCVFPACCISAHIPRRCTCRIDSESAQSLACGERDGRLVFAISRLGTAQGTVPEDACSVLPSFLIGLWVKDMHLFQFSEFSHLILQCGRRCSITLPCEQFQRWGKSARFNSPLHLEP